jgi:hypothetical protein
LINERAQAYAYRHPQRPLVKISPVYQPERFVCDDLFELVLGCAGTGDVRRASFGRDMVYPMPTQAVIINCEFSRGSLDRRARCQETLDPHALDMIAALASSGSRALWSWHLISPYLYLQKNEVSAISYFH